MKKTFLLVAFLAALAACKKHDAAPKQFLLSKVIINGQTDEEYIYDNKGQLIELRTYTPQLSVYSYPYVYDTSGKLKEMLQIELPGAKPYGKWIYTLDANGRIKRAAAYSLTGADSGKLSTYIDHEFDDNNRLIQQIWRDENEEETSVRQLHYYPNGNIRLSESYNVYNQVASKNYATNYAPSDTTLPASFYKITAMPLNYYYYELMCPSMTQYTYNNGQVTEEAKQVMSNRKYNAQGLVVQQTITVKKIKPAGPDEVRMMQYEYKAW